MTKEEEANIATANTATFTVWTHHLESAMFWLRSKKTTMGTNTGKGYRQGAVRGRTQFQQPNGDWQKRDEGNGHFMERKSSPEPFKGVAKEPDGRDTKNA